MFTPSTKVSYHLYKMGTVERVKEFRNKHWITKAQNRRFMLETEYDPETVMTQLDTIEHDLFWKRNSGCNVFTVWLAQFLIWTSILYQSASLYHGIIWDTWYTSMFFLMIFGFALMDATDPIHYPS